MLQMRNISDIKKDIIDIKNTIPVDNWKRLRLLLDEIFINYMIKIKNKTVATIIDNIEHYRRHIQRDDDIYDIIDDIIAIIQNETDAKTEYEINNLIEKDFAESWKNNE